MAAQEFVVRVRLVGDATDLDRTLTATATKTDRFTQTVRKNWLKLAAVAATVVGVFREIQRAATLENQTQALKTQLAAQGIAFDAYIAKLKEVSGSQIATSDLIASSSRALLLGIPATEIAGLLEVARASAVATGQSIGRAFDDITRGVARQSKLILDNLGIIIDLSDAWDNYAVSVGKTADELTAQERVLAIIRDIQESTADSTERLTAAQSKLAASLAVGAASAKNFRDTLGRIGGSIGLAFLATLQGIGAVALRLASAFAEADAALARFVSRLPGVELEETAVALDKVAERLRTTSDAWFESAKGMSEAADASFKAALGFEDAAKALDLVAGAADRATGAVKAMKSEMDESEEAVVKLGQALGIITTIEIEQKMLDIGNALHEAAIQLGENSDEFVKLREVAGRELERLEEDLLRVKDGLEPLTESVKDGREEWDRYGDEVGDASDELDRNSRELDENSDRLNRNTLAQQQNSASRNLLGGVSEFSQISGGTFTTVGRRIVQDPDGTLRSVPIQ